MAETETLEPTATTETAAPETGLADALSSKNAIVQASKDALAKLAAAKSETATEPEAVETEPTDGPARNPDGTFAKKDATPEATDAEPETTATDAEPEPEPTEPEGEDTTDEPEPELTVTLEGLSERGEDDIEIAVDSPEALERLRRLKNDAMRGRDYRTKMQEVQAKQDELADIEVAVQTNPVGFLLDMVQPDRRVEVAKALLVEHFDELQPVIETYLESPVDAVKARLAAKEQARELAKMTEAQAQHHRAARAILSATEALVPEGVDHKVAAEFLRDAERDLVDAVRSKVQVTPDNVGKILAKRIRMYGFASNGKDGTPQVAARTLPSKDRGTLTVDAAKAAQAKVKKVQDQRKAAAAIAPAGRGTVVTKAPLIPKTATIEEASKFYLRSKSGG